MTRAASTETITTTSTTNSNKEQREQQHAMWAGRSARLVLSPRDAAAAATVADEVDLPLVPQRHLVSCWLSAYLYSVLPTEWLSCRERGSDGNVTPSSIEGRGPRV